MPPEDGAPTARTTRKDQATTLPPENAPTLIDACFNLTHDAFRKDEAQVLARARAAGVRAMIVPGSSLADSADAIERAARHPGVLFPAAGVHPHLAKEWGDNSRARLHALVRDHAVVAVGETGLDYCRDLSPRAQQLQAFEQQIAVAEDTGLPLFLHQREAHDDFIAVLKPRRAGITAAVAHCFTGERRELDAYLELDLYIGITGWICDERRGVRLGQLVKAIPLDRLLLETDAPYLVPRDLAPEQRPRGRRNEPALLAHIAARVGACAGVGVEELAQRTTANAQRLFGLCT